jgi:hypothetical protein
MDSQQALYMLRSRSTESKRNVVRYLLRHGVSGFEPSVRLALVDLVSEADELAADLRELIIRNPNPEFVPLFRRLLAEGSAIDRQRALEGLETWLRSGLVETGEIHDSVVACSRSDSPWLRVLAFLQDARQFGEARRAWQGIAVAISEADQKEWWRSLRPQVEELLSPAEIAEVNRELESMGAATLRPLSRRAE